MPSTIPILLLPHTILLTIWNLGALISPMQCKFFIGLWSECERGSRVRNEFTIHVHILPRNELNICFQAKIRDYNLSPTPFLLYIVPCWKYGNTYNLLVLNTAANKHFSNVITYSLIVLLWHTMSSLNSY